MRENPPEILVQPASVSGSQTAVKILNSKLQTRLKNEFLTTEFVFTFTALSVITEQSVQLSDPEALS
jgi:hypothetical protein